MKRILYWSLVLAWVIVALALRWDASPASSAGVLPAAASAGSSLSVTLADDDKAISLSAGGSMRLALVEGYDWTAAAADPTVLSRRVGVLAAGDAQPLFEAHRAGRTTLIAVGDPICRREASPCGEPSREFRINVVVE